MGDIDVPRPIDFHNDQPRALEIAGFADVRLMLDKGGVALYSARRG